MLAYMLRRTTILLALLSLTSCSSRSISELRGQIRGWQGGVGRIEVLDDNLKTLSSAPLAATGMFNLKLPTEQQLSSDLQESLVPSDLTTCSNAVKASSAAQYYMIGDLTAFAAQGNKVAYTVTSQTWNADHTKLDKRVLIYATQPVQVQGNLSCGANVASYHLSLKQGWNYAVSRQSRTERGSSTVIETAAGKDGFEGWSLNSTVPAAQ